ncbi:helix-turn-helix domain-containing protein [Mammaliicoccus sciuri]|uniref:helix-turn-helix domain-containing protein n=1 Tax=Mammaliicoccus sciuri TaxID=1296 RepID=UPI00194DD83F|nr:helix-turn-helix transcriptional regulator [Mammaliicoccus sciuri]MEB6096630.1 helix-turn-helix transcriptional regulator [Mammaliicoccus sciuri]MEB7732186.1 helix-turn-helix transcriptional regulator [Mammaliicoccus sciuri]MEB8130301.1 helix-turn-helix transcriptional regulator [Mammaliicoccus sciuri]
MIKIKLDEILKEKHVSLTELAQEVDITIANLSILKTGKAKAVRFSTLEAICEYLDCQPGEIMVYEKDAE